jgi:UDP-N-acetylmuramoylalanine--D-glutamate ligase
MKTDNRPFQKLAHDFGGKKILIMGLGLLGQGVDNARFFYMLGAKVRVTDLKTADQLKTSLESLKNIPIDYVLGQHRYSDFDWADIIIKNPGVWPSSEFLVYAQKKGKPIFMDTSLFCQYSKLKTIAITGTRGKSTTTMLIYQLLKKAGLKPLLGGNLPGKATLPLLEQANKYKTAVLELSSWQLRGFQKIKYGPDIAILTNVYPDHLNYYSNINDYIMDKRLIFQYQDLHDIFITNKNNAICRELAKTCPSKVCFFSSSQITTDFPNLPGDHNRENITAVYALADAMNIKADLVEKTVREYQGLPFRLQTVATVNQVVYINDSCSTTPIATQVALKAISAPIILIIGGNSKNLPDEQMLELAGQKSKAIAIIDGGYSQQMRTKLIDKGYGQKIMGYYTNLADLLKAVSQYAKSGDTVLFSPGYTSFGMFSNEFDRGEQFNQTLKKLINHEKQPTDR